jgi:hypothetical protein
MRRDKLIRIAGMITPKGWVGFVNRIRKSIHAYGADDLARVYRASIDAMVSQQEQKRQLSEREGLARNPWDPNTFDYELAPTKSLAKKDYGPLLPGKRPYRPGVGFFPRSDERGLIDPATFYRAYSLIPPIMAEKKGKDGSHMMKVKWPWSGNIDESPERWIRWYVYKHYKVGVPLDNGQVDVSNVDLWKKRAVPLVFANVGELLKKRGVGAALHNIDIAFVPKVPYMTRKFHIEGLPPQIGDATGCYLGAGGFELIRIATGISTLGQGIEGGKAGMNVIEEFVKITRDKIYELAPSWKKGFGKDPEEDAVLIELSRTIITLLHELGHRVDRKCLEDDKPKLFHMWMEHKDDNPVSTPYGIVNPAEWFAEAWVAWLIDGLAYNKDVKAAFEDILQVVPSAFQPVSLDAFTDKVTKMMDDALAPIASPESVKLPSIKKGDRFTMTVTYAKGPEKKIRGYLVGIRRKRPLPTLAYRQEGWVCPSHGAHPHAKGCSMCGTDLVAVKSEQIYHFTCFPNREITSIEEEKG